MSRIKLVVQLVYSHKTNVVIVSLLAFVMIYITVILVNPAAAFGVCHRSSAAVGADELRPSRIFA